MQLFNFLFIFCFRYFTDKIEENIVYFNKINYATNIKDFININNKKNKKYEYIKLSNLVYSHNLTTNSAKIKNINRINILLNSIDSINNKLSINELNLYMPSITNIKVYKNNDNEYIIQEGNSRVYALKDVFNDDFLIEVELYY